jgi:hypothetical protein
MIRARAEEKAGEKREQRRVEVRTGLVRRGFAGCLVVVDGGGEEMRAMRWSFAQKRMGSCRGCMMGVEVEGHLASLADGCRLRCDDGEDRAIACLTAGVEVGPAKQVEVVEAAVAGAGSLVVCLMKESRLGQRCQLSRIGEEILAGAQELHCGKSSGVPQSVMRVGENHRMASGLVTQAYLALGSCCQ